MMAKILEKKTIYGSVVMEKMAGIESSANITSVNSIMISTMKSGVKKNFPSILFQK